MRNLLQETLESIRESGHSKGDITFIGSESSGHSCTWQEFEKLADIEYNEDLGIQRVAADLIIVFSDGQRLWRGEYDGSEWWNFSKPFVMPENLKPLKSLFRDDYGWNE